MRGKTNQPLHIMVDMDMLDEPEMQTLLQQGHVVYGVSADYDIILSRKAWRYDSKYVDLAIKAARAAKKEVKV